MKITAKTTFVHGAHSMKRLQTADVPASTARELEAAGLVSVVEEKKAPEPDNKMNAAPKNKGKEK